MDFSNPRIIGQSNHDGQDNSGYYNSDLQSDEVQTYLSDNPGVQHFDDWTPPKIPNHISPQPEVQPEATFGPKETDSNNSSRTEPTFHLQDTSALSTQDLTSAIELDPSLLLYGTNFDKLLAQDPVHVHIMRLVEKHAKDPRIPVYAKVGFLKLATINKAKVGNLQDVELDSMMAAVRLAQHNNEERRNAENEYEKVIRDCIDQYHWLHDKNNRLQDKVAGTFRNILKSTGYDIPKAINPKAVDDLSCILVASTSDWYYKTAPGITLDVDMTDQATPDDTLDTDMTDQAASTEDLATPSSLEYNFKPPEAPSVPIKRICVNVITHLSLLGGRPANVSRFYTHDYASFDGFMNRLSKARGQSRAQYPERLGFLTDQQMELGKWLYQMATGMETLDLERNAWRLVDEKSYDTLSCAENEQIFLIHEYHQSMPARIREKLRGMPKRWNTWARVEHPTMEGFPVPEFLPCFEDTVIVPASFCMTDLKTALLKPHGRGVTGEQWKEKRKERMSKRVRRKKAQLAAAAAAAAAKEAAPAPAVFTLPFR